MWGHWRTRNDCRPGLHAGRTLFISREEFPTYFPGEGINPRRCRVFYSAGHPTYGRPRNDISGRHYSAVGRKFRIPEKIIVIAEFSVATKLRRKISATSRARGPIPANAESKPPFGGGRGHFRRRENSAMTMIGLRFFLAAMLLPRRTTKTTLPPPKHTSPVFAVRFLRSRWKKDPRGHRSRRIGFLPRSSHAAPSLRGIVSTNIRKKKNAPDKEQVLVQRGKTASVPSPGDAIGRR